MSFPKILVGGPWYGHKIDVRTAMTIVRLQRVLGSALLDVAWQDTQLDLARNMLLAGALAHEGKAEWFVSIDADCSFPGGVETKFLGALKDATRTDTAVVGVPLPCGSGRSNVRELPGARTPVGSLHLVEAVGFGIVAFRLGWYVTHWPPEAPFFQTIVLPRRPGERFHVHGEDHGHCFAVRRLGGLVWSAPLPAHHHMTRHGHPLQTQIDGGILWDKCDCGLLKNHGGEHRGENVQGPTEGA